MKKEITETVNWIVNGFTFNAGWYSSTRKGELMSELWYLYEVYGIKAIYELAKELTRRGLCSTGYLREDREYGLVPGLEIMDSSKELLLAA